MSRTITVATPENIQVTYQVAGVASRFLASVVDLAIQIVLFLAVSLTIQLATGQKGMEGVQLSAIVSALGIILLYLLILGYATFFEMLWGGRTPGKRLFGLRVIREGGYPINLMASVIRNILRIIDFGIIPLAGTALVLCGLPGLLCIFLSPQYKRIGDYAAGTLVILEAGASPFSTQRRTIALSPAVETFLPLVKHLDRLTAEEYRILRRFTSRRNELELAVQASIGERLARPLLEKLEMELSIPFQIQYADLLEAIEHRYAEEHGLL